MRHTCPDVALTELSYAALWTRPNFTAPSHRYSLRKLEDFKICVRNKFPQKKKKKRWQRPLVHNLNGGALSTKSLYRLGPSQH